MVVGPVTPFFNGDFCRQASQFGEIVTAAHRKGRVASDFKMEVRKVAAVGVANCSELLPASNAVIHWHMNAVEVTV